MAGSEARQGRRQRLLAGAFGVVALAVVVVALAVVGVGRGSGPDSVRLGRSTSVVLVSIPGLRWQDLDAVAAPTLEGLIEATALLSVRAIGLDTSIDEAYLTIGAGNRIDAPDADFVVRSAEQGSDVCVSQSVLESARRSAEDARAGARAGALGTALSDAGVDVSVWGRASAIAALMSEDGCVGAYSVGVPSMLPPGVSIVEVGDLTITDRALERREELEAIESRLAALVMPAEATVLVVAPAATGDAPEVTVAGVRSAVASALSDGAALVSATTRRADYVTLPDVAPTVLEVLGLEAPDSMNGTSIRVVDADGHGASSATTEVLDRRIAHLADLADRVAFRDRAVGPVSVVLVVVAVLCAVAALSRRSRVARMLAPVLLAYPTLTFLLGATPYHRLPLDAVVALLLFGSVALGACAVSVASRLGPAAPATALACVLWLVVMVDVVSGSRLQINTPLGYTPTIAGRFQGFGNLAFGLVAASGLAVAVGYALVVERTETPVPRTRRHDHRTPRVAVWWAAWVGAVTTIGVAAPAFGSDVGGTLAFVPGCAIGVATLAGVRLGWRRVALAVGVGAAVVVLGAWIDMQRPPDRRTHAGRFLGDLVDGDGWLVVRRKLASNLDMVTASVWSVLFALALGACAVAVWARRERMLGMLATRPVERAYLAGWSSVAALGFALNDSGIAVVAIMAVIGGAWTVSAVMPVTRREGR
jgi:hypothetical protein